jgi:tellurite resistance protein
MPNRNTRNRLGATDAEIMASWQESREDELIDAVASAAALVARADGSAEPVERREIIDFLRRDGNFATMTQTDLVEAFEHRLRHLDERSGIKSAIDSLRRLAHRRSNRLVVDVAERVAAADGYLHPRELHLLQLIRLVLGAPSRPRLA